MPHLRHPVAATSDLLVRQQDPLDRAPLTNPPATAHGCTGDLRMPRFEGERSSPAVPDSRVLADEHASLQGRKPRQIAIPRCCPHCAQWRSSYLRAVREASKAWRAAPSRVPSGVGRRPGSNDTESGGP